MKKLLWLDIETTGLDERECSILEISAIVTDENLNELDTFDEVIHVGQSALDQQMNDWCRKTHTESGLLDDIAKSKNTRLTVQQSLLYFIEKNFGSEKPIMCGNSIHFDRGFLKQHMIGIVNKLHHRMIDVSGMNELFKLTKGIESPKHVSKHRGLSDVRDSIALAKRLLDRVS